MNSTIQKIPVDKNGQEFFGGVTVQVPDPTPNDLWIHSFAGTVAGMHGDYVSVCDGDGDHWDVEPERLEILN